MKSPTTRSRGTPRLNVQLRFPSTTRICIAHPYFVSTESEAYRNNEQVIWGKCPALMPRVTREPQLTRPAYNHRGVPRPSRLAPIGFTRGAAQRRHTRSRPHHRPAPCRRRSGLSHRAQEQEDRGHRLPAHEQAAQCRPTDSCYP